MKTSKKLLSLFLAVVMMVTTCSVGFTAFAAEKDNGIWKDSTSADTTFAALTDMANTYAPELFNIDAVKKGLEDGLGMKVTKDTSISDVVAGVAPVLLNLLFSLDPDKFTSDPEVILGQYRPFVDDFAYAYLEDPDAPMSFYELFAFAYNCYDSEDEALAEWAQNAVEGDVEPINLINLLDAFSFLQTERQEKIENSRAVLESALSTIDSLLGEQRPDSLAAVKALSLTYNGEVCTVDDLINFPEFADAKDILADYNAYLEIAKSNIRIQSLSDAYWYITDVDAETPAVIDEAFKSYLCSLAKVDYASVKDNEEKLNQACALGAVAYTGKNIDDIKKSIEADKITAAQTRKLINDLKAYDSNGYVIGTTPESFRKYLNGETISNVKCDLKPTVVKYLLQLSDKALSSLGEAITDDDETAQAAIDQINADFYLYFFDSTFNPHIDEDYRYYEPTADEMVRMLKDVYEGKDINAHYDFKYEYDNYDMSQERIIVALNTILNQYVSKLFDPNDTEGISIPISGLSINLSGSMIVPMIDGLLETKIDLKEVLTDLFLNLYKQPIETLVRLIPTVVVLLDELIIPTFCTDNEDGLADLILGFLENETQKAGSPTGIGSLAFDLNKIVPTLMHWLLADENYDFTYYNVSKNEDGTLTYGETTTGKYDLNKTPVILNIYVADQNLQYAKISDIKGEAGEAVTELATFFTAAVEQYVKEHGDDAKSSPMTESDGHIANRGLNNLFVAIPQVLDIMGKNFIAKYEIPSDWSYCDYKIKSEKIAGITCWYNQSLVDFKNLAAAGKAEDILECFVNIFINDWFNALIDLLNDATATNNKLTGNIPIISGLLQALGGLGNKSVLSDILNGVFQLQYTDDASFVLDVYNKESGFVGLNTKSAYFLLSNIGQLVNVITSIDTKVQNKVEQKFPDSVPAGAKPSPVWDGVPKTAGLVDGSNGSSSKNDSFLTKLDTMLAGILEKSTINNFNMNTTTGILSGVISLLSYYIGSDNSDYLMKYLNAYLNALNDQDKKSTNTSDQQIYTEKNLTNLLVQTYVLLENILDYYLVNEDAVKINIFYDSNQKVYSENGDNRYVYNILAAALKGLISPHAVSNHITNDSARKKIASLASWHNAISPNKKTNGTTGATNISINWGFSAGDTNGFFSGMAEGLGIITDLLDVLLCDAGYYDTVLYPILKDLDTAQTADLGVYAPGTVKNGVTGLLSIITPVSKLLDAFYSQPVTVILNLVKGLAIIVNQDLNNVAHAVFAPLNNEIKGISNILSANVSNLCPSLAENNAWFNTLLQMIICKDSKNPTKEELETLNTINGLLNGQFTITDATLIELINGLTSSLGITIPKDFFQKLAACKNADAVLEYLLKFVVKILTNNDVIDLLKALINNESVSQLLDMISRLTYDDLMNIINAVLAKTTDPTEVYWTFLQYVQEKTTGFYYPAGITAADAKDAVGQLDNMVVSVFALLNGLDVVKQDSLSDVVNELLFTNDNLTALAKALYGAIDPYAQYLAYANIDVSKNGVAAALTDKSYGKTYSSAAKAIKKAKSWKKLGKVNWGFTDGSAKAQKGFVNALAAILRPFDDVLTLLLAGDNLAVGSIVKDLVSGLSVGKSSDTVQFKNGQLIIKVKGNDKYSKTSTIKLDVNAAIKEIEDLKIYGGNGYESAIVPLLEAFECSGVKTYKQYKADIKKAKDNVLIDVLNPILGLVNDVLEAPFDTLTAILPNVAYYIDNNGVAQLVNNLLSPVTSLLPVLKNNGLNVNTIIKAFTNGQSLNAIVTKALGVNIHLDLNNLNKCDIQNAVVPLINSLLKKYKITLPNIDWGTLASHGKVSTVKSAAKNSQGKYTRKHVTAKQGETLIAVLRYIANTLTSNVQSIKKLLGGIDAIKDAKGIINAVLNQIGTASADQIIRAIFYFLQEEPTNAFWDYTKYQTKEYDFSYPETVDVKFLKNIPPMLDGLISELLPLNKTVSDALFKDELISKMVQGIGKAMDGVKINDNTTLTDLLAMTGVDYSTKNVAKLLNNEAYGQTYAANASVIGAASSWSKVNVSSLKWGVTDKDSFFHALCAALRPFYGVLDVLLNDASLGIFNIVYIPGSNGYTACIVPLLEAFSAYNIKTQYQYREDISKAYDNILLDILNPLWEKVEDILNAPLQTLMAMLPNLALFIANDGLIQLIKNLLTPVSALLDAIKPIVDVNVVLDKVFEMLGVNLNKEIAKIGLNIDLNINLYDLPAMLKPIIGAEHIVPLLKQALGLIKIDGKPLGIELMDIDWFQLASHGTYVKAASQAATFGARVYVEGDASETLIALLRYLVEVINYKDNYNVISNLIGSLIGGSDNTAIVDTVNTVLAELQGETDDVISALCELLQQIGG